MRKFDNDSKRSDYYQALQIQCRHCEYKKVIPVFEDKLICPCCGKWIYRDKTLEFQEEMKKRLKNENRVKSV